MIFASLLFYYFLVLLFEGFQTFAKKYLYFSIVPRLIFVIPMFFGFSKSNLADFKTGKKSAKLFGRQTETNNYYSSCNIGQLKKHNKYYKKYIFSECVLEGLCSS